MKHFKTSILASAMCLAASSLCQTVSAQIHLTADLQNNHLWRGMEVADGCLILTDLSYTFGAGHTHSDCGAAPTHKATTRSSTTT